MTPHDKKQLVRALQPVLDRVRKDISAIKFDDGSRWTKQPLTAENMERHVNGGPPRGACPIKEGESVTMLAVLDLDSHKGQTSWEGMMLAAMALRDALRMWGMEAVAFRSSGGRGIHLLVLWEMPQDAYSVRQAVFAAMSMAGFESGTGGVAKGQVEVFPKQDEVGVGENGNQFILPLAGPSEPLDLDLGIPLGRDAVIGMHWPMSQPVVEMERPARNTTDLPSASEPLEKVREALFSIKNDGSAGSPEYEEWFKLACAVHEATGGSDEGRALFHEWSEQHPLYDEKFTDDRIIDYIKPAGKRSTAITRGTLYAMAGQQGWSSASPEGFGDVIEASPVGGALEAQGEVAESISAGVDGRDLPPFERDRKTEEIFATIGNLLMALRRPDVCGWKISHDRFRDEIMISTNGGMAWRGFRDADYTRMREYLEKNGFQPIGKEMMRDAVELVAQETGFDSAILWIKSLPARAADEPSRVETFMSKYMGCEDTPYARALSLYMWTALAGRVLSPGCQADMTPVFIGEQGSGKSSAVMAISPSLDFYVEIGFHEKEDDLARKMRGRLVGEFGELTGMRKKEVDALKAFITRRNENWIPKFKEFGSTFPRRLLFIGTTNNEKFLIDDTGNRRWLPIRVGKTDLAALKRDVLLIWAEARDLFIASGVQWAEAERLARDVHSEHEVDDPWEQKVASWLKQADPEHGTKAAACSYLTTGMVLFEALGMPAGRTTRGDEMRAGSVLKKMGFQKKRIREGKELISAYVHTSFTPENDQVGTDIPF